MKRIVLLLLSCLLANLAMAGSISGAVYDESAASKNGGVGDPITGRTIVLEDAATGLEIGRVATDGSGHFQFPNVPLGSYYISGEVFGKTNPKLGITLTNTRPNAMDIIFRENDRTIQGHNGNVGIGSLSALKGIAVYPSPATNYVTVAGLSTIFGAKLITLRNMAGAELSRQLTREGDASIDITALPPGIYHLELRTEVGNATYQVCK